MFGNVLSINLYILLHMLLLSSVSHVFNIVRYVVCFWRYFYVIYIYIYIVKNRRIPNEKISFSWSYLSTTNMHREGQLQSRSQQMQSGSMLSPSRHSVAWKSLQTKKKVLFIKSYLGTNNVSFTRICMLKIIEYKSC